jgi:hypothetical protein
MALRVETTLVATEGNEAILGAMAYFAVLAYPRDHRKRNDFVDGAKAICAGLSLSAAEIKPWYRRSLKNGEADRTLRRGINEVMFKRLAAAQMAWWLFNDDLQLGNVRLRVRDPLGNPNRASSRLSVKSAADVLADLVRSKTKETAYRVHHDSKVERWTPENVLTRIWTPSKPVLHLAMAFPAFGLPPGERSLDPIAMMLNPVWLRGTLIKAQGMRALLPDRIPTFDPRNTVDLLPREDPERVGPLQGTLPPRNKAT